ncbi:helix-turn-helix domain-containing protein [Deminuibacter soli]|uniref:AraC family transcriptional regulator n=1 Tax=Deminuibacter soli TaxID=2291815 RepID=A0A3E1NJA4_9BACT|nr:helix-turn-helix domain-containing protein [Deminuibacter soli]RFM28017.1 AraC family transcriptional regulator [Deminuibacter soli]
MLYYTLPPSLLLSPFVRAYWVLEHEVPAGQPYVYRSMADGLPEMIFHYKGRFKQLTQQGALSEPLSMIHGQGTQYHRFITHESFGIFGVYFYPFAFQRLFGMPAAEFSDQMPGLETFLGNTGRELEQQVLAADSNTARAALVTGFLEQQLRMHPVIPEAMASPVLQLIASKGTISVQQLAYDHCLSIRQFQRRFKEAAGFSPKRYARIIRFQHALTHYGNRLRPLTDIAYSCGYYDQAHFIHDFKQFSGYEPGQYFHGNPEGAEWRDG